MTRTDNKKKSNPSTTEEYLVAIIERRESIREHRDQKGDDRCFLDDYPVWAWLADSSPEPKRIAPKKGMESCLLFYKCRRAEVPDPAPEDAIAESAHWDDDLSGMTPEELRDELKRIEGAIREHRDIVGRPRTLEDDRALYGILPEKVPADFRLPPKEEFLGEARAPHAGCPAFWRSHGGCMTKCHDYHKWGPCGGTCD